MDTLGREIERREKIMDKDLALQYLETLNTISKTHNGGNGNYVPYYNELPPLAQRIVSEIKKEERLTYAQAYINLECALKYLQAESNFVQVERE